MEWMAGDGRRGPMIDLPLFYCIKHPSFLSNLFTELLLLQR